MAITIKEIFEINKFIALHITSTMVRSELSVLVISKSGHRKKPRPLGCKFAPCATGFDFIKLNHVFNMEE